MGSDAGEQVSTVMGACGSSLLTFSLFPVMGESKVITKNNVKEVLEVWRKRERYENSPLGE